MAGAVIIIAVLLVLPMIMGMVGVVLAAVLGWSVKNDVDVAHEGSELLELNK